MTRRKSLKRRTRARMARTGESYTTARRHVINRLEARSAPVGDQLGSPAEVGPRRRPIWIAAVELALVGTAIAAVIAVDGAGGSKDTAGRYAGFEVPCSGCCGPLNSPSITLSTSSSPLRARPEGRAGHFETCISTCGVLVRRRRRPRSRQRSPSHEREPTATIHLGRGLGPTPAGEPS